MTTPERGEFLEAQRRMLSRHGVEAESRFVPVPAVGGRAHVLEVGDGPELVMLNGLGTPAAMWAPLMAELDGRRLLAVDLPGYGLTDTGKRFADDLRENAVSFLAGTLDALELSRPDVAANSLGSLWAIWLALERPERVGAMVHVGCPAATPGTVPPRFSSGCSRSRPWGGSWPVSSRPRRARSRSSRRWSGSIPWNRSSSTCWWPRRGFRASSTRSSPRSTPCCGYGATVRRWSSRAGSWSG